MSTAPAPSLETYGELQTAYDHFNAELFDGALPACLITLQREKHTYGYFSPKRFGAEDGRVTDEIAMNPTFFAVQPVSEVMQTLVHEMAHLWQAHFGKPSRRGYHNKEWGAKMEAIGLMPSSTGQPGGKKLGEKMADYPIPGGRFEAACESLQTEAFRITWRDRVPALRPTPPRPEGEDGGEDEADAPEGTEAAKPNKSNRYKYSCPGCSLNVWGKPGLRLMCADCSQSLECPDAL